MSFQHTKYPTDSSTAAFRAGPSHSLLPQPPQAPELLRTQRHADSSEVLLPTLPSPAAARPPPRLSSSRDPIRSPIPLPAKPNHTIIASQEARRFLQPFPTSAPLTARYHIPRESFSSPTPRTGSLLALTRSPWLPRKFTARSLNLLSALPSITPPSPPLTAQTPPSPGARTLPPLLPFLHGSGSAPKPPFPGLPNPWPGPPAALPAPGEGSTHPLSRITLLSPQSQAPPAWLRNMLKSCPVWSPWWKHSAHSDMQGEMPHVRQR